MTTEEFTFHSTDPDRYNEIFCPVPYTRGSQLVEWSVSMLSGFCNIAVITKDDYIEFTKLEGLNKTVYKVDMMSDYSSFDEGFSEILLDLLKDTEIICSTDRCGRFSFTCRDRFQITGISYRMRQVLGLFHEELPIDSRYLGSPADEFYIDVKSKGFSCYSPMLMLLSNMGAPNTVADPDNPLFYRNTYIAMKFGNNLTPGQPLSAASTENPVRVTSNALSNLRLTLVDSNFSPVIVLSPLTVTLTVTTIHEKLQEIDEAMVDAGSNAELNKARNEFYKERFQKLRDRIQHQENARDPRWVEQNSPQINIDDYVQPIAELANARSLARATTAEEEEVHEEPVEPVSHERESQDPPPDDTPPESQD